MQLAELSVGKPALWKSTIYGDVAVHVKSVHHGIALVTVDGGEAARQVIDYPELADGWFVIPERLHKRAGKPSKAVVKNTIRDVPGVGKVAIVTDDRPKTTAQRSKRRMSLTQALSYARNMADAYPNQYNWPVADDRPKVVRRSRRPVQPVSTVGSLGLSEEF